jgi:hypothetical protein
MELIFVI